MQGKESNRTSPLYAPRSLSVLVVDDDESFRQVFCAMLESLGCTVNSASSAQAALELVRTSRPEIVFTDLLMPQMTGSELTKWICSEKQDILVAVMTAHSDEANVIRSLRAGASDFIRKPFAIAEVEDTLNRFRDVLIRRELSLITPELLEEMTFTLTVSSNDKAIRPAIQMVSALLRGYVTENEALRIELALGEMLRNAYEHGNLGISCEEKKVLIEEGKFDQEMQRRAVTEQNKHQLIKLSYSLTPNSFSATVEDEGVGFDWRGIIYGLNPLPASLLAPNGRGLVIVSKVFDMVEFNDNGNAVTVTKLLDNPGTIPSLDWD